jgi:hypothetical protein
VAPKQKRSLIDDLADGIRQVLDDIDTFFNPEKKKQRARVPVPVRSRPDPRDPRNNPYNR